MTRALVDAWEPIGEPRGEPRRRLPPLTAAMRRMVAERDAAELAQRLGRDGTAGAAGEPGSARMIVDRSMVGRIGRGRGPLPPPTVVDWLGRVTTPEEERRIEIAAALALRMARAEADVEAGVAGVRAPRLGHPSLEEIKRAVARVWDVTLVDLVSRRRDKAVIEPRQAAMWIARRVTERSLPEIGRRLGGRDHTTVLHGVTQTEARMRANAGLTARIAEALARLGLDAEDVGGGLGLGLRLGLGQGRAGTAARETVSEVARSRGVEGAP